jgi:hypothetical protein
MDTITSPLVGTVSGCIDSVVAQGMKKNIDFRLLVRTEIDELRSASRPTALYSSSPWSSDW